MKNYNVKEIAELLNKSERTIRREIKRGLTINLTSELEEIKVYSADISNEEYKSNMKAKGQELKIGSDRKTIELIEKMIKEELLQKMNSFYYEDRSNFVLSEAEQSVGQSIDFKG